MIPHSLRAYTTGKSTVLYDLKESVRNNFSLIFLVFGVTTKGENPISFTQNFQSTTERVVGVELNLNTLEIRYFI